MPDNAPLVSPRSPSPFSSPRGLRTYRGIGFRPTTAQDFAHDILQEIFRYTVLLRLETDDYFDWTKADFVRSSINTSLRLASVCRWWRAIACSTPALWSNAVLVPERESPVRDQTKLAHLSLDRCRSLSLVLQIDPSYATSGLMTFLSRLQVSDIALHQLSIAVHILPECQHLPAGILTPTLTSPAAQQMRDVVIQGFSWIKLLDLPLPINLRRIYVASPNSWTLTKPFANLRVLQIRVLVTPVFVNDILRFCPNLRELAVRISKGDNPPKETAIVSGRRQVSHLEYLAICIPMYPVTFLDDFDFPFLHTIQFDNHRMARHSILPVLSHPSFLQRAKVLRLGFAASRDLTGEILSRTTELTELSLILNDINDGYQVIPMLTENMIARSPMLLHLKRLHFGLRAISSLSQLLDNLKSLQRAWATDTLIHQSSPDNSGGSHSSQKPSKFLYLHADRAEDPTLSLDFLNSIRGASPTVEVNLVSYGLSPGGFYGHASMFTRPSMTFGPDQEKHILLVDGTYQRVCGEL